MVLTVPVAVMVLLPMLTLAVALPLALTLALTLKPTFTLTLEVPVPLDDTLALPLLPENELVPKSTARLTPITRLGLHHAAGQHGGLEDVAQIVLVLWYQEICGLATGANHVNCLFVEGCVVWRKQRFFTSRGKLRDQFFVSAVINILHGGF